MKKIDKKTSIVMETGDHFKNRTNLISKMIRSIFRFCALLLATGLIMFGCQDGDDEINSELPSTTAVEDNVFVYSPANGTTIEENIIEYVPNKRIVFKTSANQTGTRSISTDNTDVKITNFNTGETSDLYPGMCVSIPPNSFIPDGALLKITDAQYGTGSVVVDFTVPTWDEVVKEAAIQQKVNLWEFFPKTQGSVKIPVTDDITLSATFTNNSAKQSAKITLAAEYQLGTLPGTSQPGKVKLVGSCELSPTLDVRIFHKNGMGLPTVFDFNFAGDIDFKLDAEIALKLAAKFGKNFHLMEIPLGGFPLGPTPIVVTPTLILSLEVGATGEIKASMNLIDYSYKFAYYAGYDKGDWQKRIETKGTYTPHNWELETKLTASVYGSLEIGLYCRIMNWDGVQLGVGGGLKPEATLSYESFTDKIDVEVSATAYVFGEFNMYVLYKKAFEGKVTGDLAKWTIYKFSSEYKENDEESRIRAMLVKLYNDTNGNKWTNNTNWLSDKPINEWYGITYSPGKLSIVIYTNNLSGSIDMSGCTELEKLDCGFNQLSSINVSGCTALSVLNCGHCQLTSLNMNGCTSLTYLGCFNNQLTSLNVNGFTEMKSLFCTANQLTSLNVSGFSKLEILWCFDNQLTSLNINGCTNLTNFQCEHNKILSEIPDWFSQLDRFVYDIRYSYSGGTYTDNGVGWWYPGEPASGYHGSGACNTIDDGGVEINGVIWATRNVCEPGTFVANPEDFGGYYQWNKGTPDWIAGWNGNGAFEWESINDPCPSGWRLPTNIDFLKLIDNSKVTNNYTTQNSINGVKFSDITSGKSIFLPGAGYRLRTDGNFIGINRDGEYWSSSGSYLIDTHSLFFGIDNNGTFYLYQGWSQTGHASGNSVRCVKDAGDPQIVSKIIPTQMDEAGNLKIQARVQSTYPITEMRYKVDNGNDVVIPVNEGKTELVFSTTYYNPNLAAGEHSLSFQFKNSAGWWSPIETSQFIKFANQQANLNLVASVENGLVKLSWNSISGVESYQLTRDGYVIHTFASSTHPIEMTFTDRPAVGNHTYKVTTYNEQDFTSKFSAPQTVEIKQSSSPDETKQLGMVMGNIYDENGLEMDEVTVTFSHDGKKILSQTGKYLRQGFELGISGNVSVEKEGYDFSLQAYNSSAYAITIEKPVITINWTGKKKANSNATPQDYELALQSSLTKDLNNNRLNVNEYTFISFNVKNTLTRKWTGDLILSLDEYNNGILTSSVEIGRTEKSFMGEETGNVVIDIPANTVTNELKTYSLCLRSAQKAIITRYPTKFVAGNAGINNPQEIQLVGEKVRGFDYWTEVITDALKMTNELNSYASTYSKFVKNADFVTGSHLQDMLLSDIIADFQKVSGIPVEIEKKAREYLQYIEILNQALNGNVTEDNAFWMFCKVSGEALNPVYAVYPVAPIFKMYFDVLKKSRDRILRMGNYIFDNYPVVMPYLINQGAVCISIRVNRKGLLGTHFSSFTASEVSDAISSVSIKAVRQSDGVSFGESPMYKCENNCCGRNNEELYLTLARPINNSYDNAVYIVKIEWSNGRISYVPITDDFATITGDYNNGSVKIEFDSESNIHETNTVYKTPVFPYERVFISTNHMANKIQIK